MMAPATAPARPRPWLLLAALAALLLLALPASLTPVASAQDEQAPAKTDGEGEKTSSTDASSKKPNIFLHIIESVGWFFGLILLLVSIALVTLVVLLVMEL